MPPFKYEAFVNPYIGSISELMGKGDEAKAQALLRIGEIQARAEEQRGQAWGNAVQSIGNMASKAITDYNSPEAQDRRESEKAKVAFNEMMRTPDTEVQGVRRVSDPGVQAQPADWLGKGTDEVRGVLPSKSFVPTITQTNKYKNMAAPGIGGLDTWNVDAIMQGLAQKGVSPEQAFKYSQILDSANTRMEKHHASAVNLMQQDVYGISQFPETMRLGAAKTAINKYGKNGVFSAETLQNATRSIAAIEALPADQQALATTKFLRAMSGEKPKFIARNYTDDIVDPETREIVVKGSPPHVTQPQSTPKPVEVTLPNGQKMRVTADYIPGQGGSGKYMVGDLDITSLNPQLINDPSLLELALDVEAKNDPDGIKARAISRVQPLVQGTDSTGRSFFLPRSEAGNTAPKLLPEEQSRVNGLQKMLGSIDKILAMADDPAVWEDAKKGVGSFGRGFVQSTLSKTLGVGTKNQQTLRDLISRVRANSSFEQGGKALTKTELQLVDAFTANINFDPDVSIQMLRDSRNEYLDALSVYGVNPRSNNATPKPSGKTPYEEYLARKARTNGR